MTTDSTMTDLERRVARALKLSRHLGHDDQQAARAALKAHAEWLESEGLVIKKVPEKGFRGQGWLS